MDEDLIWKRTSDRRLPQIAKLKYLSNYWPDLPRSLNLGLCDQSKTLRRFQMESASTGRQTQIEDYLKCQKWNMSATYSNIGQLKGAKN
jgi:hypothetical protein